MAKGAKPTTGGGGNNSYQRLPIVFRMGGARYASDEEKQQRRETITRFMNEAKVWNVYRLGGGIGSEGDTPEIEIVPYNSSPNKMGIKSGNYRPVAMSRANVERYIANGATLVRKSRKRAR